MSDVSKAVVAVLLLLLSSMPLMSQSITVRSGDHDRFTRLVFYLKQGSEWSLRQVENTVEIQFEESLGSPDFSRVFDRISRQRLSGIFYDEKRHVVRLALSCRCTAEGLLFAQNLLVVDIQEDPSDDNIAKPAIPVILPVILSEPRKRILEVLYPDVSDQIDDRRNHALYSRSMTTAGEPRINRFSSLIRRYVAIGVLSPEPESFGRPPESKPQRVQENAGQTDSKNHLMLFCDQPELFDLPAISSGESARSEITRYRNQVVTAAGDADLVAIEGLARTYLALGFAEEALQSASLLRGDIGEVLSQMAAQLSDGAGLEVGGQVNLETCSDRAYVWVVLGLSPESQLPALDGRTLLRSFGLLPALLKTQLAPRLANIAVEQGNLETAQLLLNRVTRQDARKTPEIDFAQASLDLARGHVDRARDTLELLARQNGPVSDDAIQALVEVPPENQDSARELAELVAIKSFENRHSAQADTFMETEFHALIAAGNLETAAALLIRLESIKEQPLENLRGAWTVALSQSADLRSQVQLLQDQDTRGLIGGGARPILTLADTMQSEGFPELASDLLLPLHAPTRDTNIIKSGLLAKTALDLGDPARAVDLLAGEVAEHFPEVLARALLAEGDFAGAAAAYAAAGQAANAARTAFLAEEWTGAADSEDIEIRAATELALGQTAPSVLENPDVLDDYRAVLTQSETTRSRVQISLGE